MVLSKISILRAGYSKFHHIGLAVAVPSITLASEFVLVQSQPSIVRSLARTGAQLPAASMVGMVPVRRNENPTLRAVSPPNSPSPTVSGGRERGRPQVETSRRRSGGGREEPGGGGEIRQSWKRRGDGGAGGGDGVGPGVHRPRRRVPRHARLVPRPAHRRKKAAPTAHFNLIASISIPSDCVYPQG